MSCSSTFLFSFTIFFLLSLRFSTINGAEQGTYIIHMARSHMPSNYELHSYWYNSSLRSVFNSAELLYTYENAIHGFSTCLTPEETKSLMTQHGVLSVSPEHRYELHTTRTLLFLGIDDHTVDLFPETGSYSDVIVGVLDTRGWPNFFSELTKAHNLLPIFFLHLFPLLLSNFGSELLPFMFSFVSSAVDFDSLVEDRDGGGMISLLEFRDLRAVIVESRQEIIKGVNLVVYKGEMCINN